MENKIYKLVVEFHFRDARNEVVILYGNSDEVKELVDNKFRQPGCCGYCVVEQTAYVPEEEYYRALCEKSKWGHR